MPKKYQLRKTIEDDVTANTHYEAFLLFQERQKAGYYSVRQEDVEFIEEVSETPTSTSEEGQT